MEIQQDFDIVSGGWRLTARKGRKKLKAWLVYSAKADKWFLSGDINRRSHSMKMLVNVFERFAQNPDAYEPGRPPTVGEMCLTIPPGMDIEQLWEAPRCRSPKDRDRALAWNKAKHKQYAPAKSPWYKRVVGAATQC
jgi:hypothetical protein